MLAIHPEVNMIKYLLAAAAGAGLEYFLDPDRGRRRRNMARDRAVAVLRRTGSTAGRKARYVSSKVRGVLQQTTQTAAREERRLEGVALAQKVKSEVLGRLGIPKNKVRISAVGNIVELRGELQDAAEIRAIEEKVLRVPGVYAVENLLRPAESG